MYMNELVTKILNGLDQLETKPNSGKRWVWELIQNAKDAAIKQGQVNIEIEFD